MLDEISAIGVQPQRIVTSVINTSFTAPLHVRRKRRGLARRSHGAVNMGGGDAFVACLRHLTIDHASLSRRSTVPTPHRDISNIWVLIKFFPDATWKRFANLIPSLFRRLSVATIYLPRQRPFSRINLVYQTSPCHIRLFSLPTPIQHVPPFIFHILRLCESYSTALPQGHICASSSSSPRLLVYLFLLSGRSRSPTRNRGFSVFA